MALSIRTATFPIGSKFRILVTPPATWEAIFLPTRPTISTNGTFLAHLLRPVALCVFASGQDLSIAGQELHTNFRLEADGGYLALVAPNGTDVVHQVLAISAATRQHLLWSTQSAEHRELVTSSANVKWHIPTSEIANWTAENYDDSSWTSIANVPSRTLLVTEFATGFNGSGNNEYFEIQNPPTRCWTRQDGWLP